MKKKLFAAALSLVMAGVLMVSSSFAWFTVSQAPEVESIEVTMTATKNLEIAKANGTTAPSEVTVNDSSAETNWGGKVTSFTGAAINFPATVPSDGDTAGKISTVKYAADGRTNGLMAATAPTTIASSGVGYYTAEPITGTSKNVAAVYGCWLRSNNSMTVKATIDATGLKVNSNNATDAQKKWVKTALATGTVSEGNVTWTVASSGTISLTADTATLVGVIVYLEGETDQSAGGVIAADVDQELVFSGIKVSFAEQTT